MSEREKNSLDRNEEADVEAHKKDLGRAEAAQTEDEPDVEGHAFELGKNELGKNELGRNELGRSETP